MFLVVFCFSFSQVSNKSEDLSKVGAFVTIQIDHDHDYYVHANRIGRRADRVNTVSAYILQTVRVRLNISIFRPRRKHSVTILLFNTFRTV